MCKEELFETCAECARKLRAMEDEKKFHKHCNQEMFDTLIKAISLLRPVLSRFRDHDYIGVKCAHTYTVRHFFYPQSLDAEKESVREPASIIKLIGKWMQPLGFEPGKKIKILSFNGLLILTPEDHKDPPGIIGELQVMNRLLGKMDKKGLQTSYSDPHK